MANKRIGIIDIGSNSVRLVVYERTENGAHRVVDGSKRSARLSGKIDENGCIVPEAVQELTDTIGHFTRICSHHHTAFIRAVATAAIRNAANKNEVLEAIRQATGLVIELLSGDEEASYGFLGMINSLGIKNGFLIDIGGGSTELSLFRDRTLVHSYSFPFGCVTLNKLFDSSIQLADDALIALEAYVTEALAPHEWIGQSPGLPLVGVGGTARALGKLHQAEIEYPFRQIHNYVITHQHVEQLFTHLRKLPLEKRRKLSGLSKDRADVIVPGIAVMRVLFHATKASRYRICGAGLRDGLFHATHFPDQPKLDDPLAYSLSNILSLHNEAPTEHVMQVNRLALEVYDELNRIHQFPKKSRMLLDIATQLYRIGASIDYYENSQHSFYLIIHSHLNGLTHREIVMVAAIASYISKGKTKQYIADYRGLLTEEDLELIFKLGMLLLLSAALDRSETQSIGQLILQATESELLLLPVNPRGTLAVERHEVNELRADFRKQWGLIPVLAYPTHYK